MRTTNGKRGGNLVGKPHNDKSGNPVGGIKAQVTDAGGKPVELEGGEVIINKEASKKYWKELSKINQSAGNGVPIEKPIDPHDEDPSEYEEGGKIIEFNRNHLPNKWILSYAKSIKKDHPEIWKLGGNIYGNTAFENLSRVAERGYWLDSEEWMYKKWQSFLARHQHDFRIAGVVAVLKWGGKVNKGWAFMKNLIEDKIKKGSTKPKSMKDGGSVEDENVVSVSKYILSRHPKKGDTFKGGKVDGFKVARIVKEVKSHGTTFKLYLIDSEDNKRVVMYQPKTNKIGDFQKSFLTASKGTYYTSWSDTDKMKEGGKVDWENIKIKEDFDWNSLFEQSITNYEPEISVEQEREESYQNSDYSKRWAATYKEAVEKTLKEFLDAKASFEDWSSRKYKSNKGVVYTGGDDIFGEAKTIGSINDSRRNNTIKGLKMVMDESIETLKNLGLSDGEITNLTETKSFEDGGEVSTSEYLNVLQKVGITEEERENWRESHKVNQRQVRNDKVKEAAEKLKNGSIPQSEYLKIVAKEQPIKLFTEVPKLPTAKEIVSALDNNKVSKGIVGFTTKIDNGTKVASRLDIPAYENYDTWVVSVHDGIKEGLIIAYGQTAYLKDVEFKTFPKTALDIATGKEKTTIGRMFGNWENKSPNDVRKMAVKYMNDPNWVQVGMNPFRHSWFYDKKDGMPLVSSSEVIQVGALVLAKNPVKTTPDNDMFIADKKSPSIKFAKGGLIAPNGEKSNLTPKQYKLVRTKAFKDWFGDWENDPKKSSKVVDDNGEPLVVYHGSPYGEFSVFKNEVGIGDFWFTSEINLAKTHTIKSRWDRKDTIPYMVEAFLNIKNPTYGYTTNWKFDEEKTNDGSVKVTTSFGNNVYVAYYPEQIKLADGSNTTFDGSNPDIRFKDGGEVKDEFANTKKLIDEIKKHSFYTKGTISTAKDGSKYRYDTYKLKYPNSSNWLVQLFEKASEENTGKSYHTQFNHTDKYSFSYDRARFKGMPHGRMGFKELVLM